MVKHYFRRTDERTFEPTHHTVGAWSREDYHFAALAGLLVHEMERSRPHKELLLSRVSFDIFGRLSLGPVEISETKVLRPGRRIELVENHAILGGRTAITARAWYLAANDTAHVSALDVEPLPAPEDCPVGGLKETWGGGFVEQLETRIARPIEPGRGALWLGSDQELVEGDERIEVAEFLARIDVANGVAPQQHPEKWGFPNVELTVHLYRQPDGKWSGVDTSVFWGPEGAGLTSSVLHDVHGPVGRAEQCLTLQEF